MKTIDENISLLGEDVLSNMNLDTVIKNIDPDNIDLSIIEEFGAMLRDGKTVIFPTETVYGLGANALDEKAAEKIYAAKGRPSDNPLLVHVSKKEDVYNLVESVNEKAEILMKHFWPGPLTIIFKKKDIIPYKTSGGLDTVAIRMPSDIVARKIIEAATVPIAAPSANISGRPSPTKGSHIVKDMNGRVDGIVLGEDCDYGLESTIIDVSGEKPMILRPGFITLEMIKDVLNEEVLIDPSIMNKEANIHAKAPGMKYKHYSPNADVYIVEGSCEDKKYKITSCVIDNNKLGLKSAVLCMDEYVKDYEGIDDLEIINLGSTYEEVCHRLFDSLIELDKRGVNIAYSHSFDEKGVGIAIMNRLKKSAGYKII